MRILVMGLPGSGKTTYAKKLSKLFGCPHINADDVRKDVNDWDFSPRGRLKQALRMRERVDRYRLAIADFVCPTPETREMFGPDFIIWMNTIKVSKYLDTNEVFTAPTHCDVVISEWNGH